MTRINDNVSDRDLKQTVNQLALRVNQLERLLDQKEWSEAKVESGSVLHRMVRTSLNNGMSKANWIQNIVGAVTKIIAGTGITVSPVTGIGDITVGNAGVTSIVAGTNVTIDPVTGLGAVTVNADDVTGLPSNANKTQYMVLQISDDVGAVDDPTKWTIDWTRWA